MKKNSLYAVLVAVIILACVLLYSRKSKEVSPIAQTTILFDTVVTVQIWDDVDPSIFDYVFQLCLEHEEKFSRTIETSEVSLINHSNGLPVEVSDDTIELIEKGIYYSTLSDGMFDITVAPLTELWDFGTNTTPPTDSEIASALENVGYEQIQIDDNTVTLNSPEAMIDLGGIAKGYIADKVKEYLVSEGVEHATINLGGNVLTIGGKPTGEAFSVGIQQPFDDTGVSITSVALGDQSAVSSGVYERYFESDGEFYHHILDPHTGYPIDNDLLGVTIISDLSIDGDALSTSVFCLGLEQGLDLVHSLEGVEAIFIDENMTIHKSAGM